MTVVLPFDCIKLCEFLQIQKMHLINMCQKDKRQLTNKAYITGMQFSIMLMICKMIHFQPRKLSCFYANPQYLFFLIIMIKHKSKILQDKKKLALILCGRQ